MHLIVDERKRRYGITQTRQEKGWVKATPSMKDLQGTMPDEEYNYIAGYHKQLIIRVLDQLPKEQQHTLVVFGRFSFPLAVEFSHWDYRVLYLTQSWDETKGVMRNMDVHAGEYLTIVEQDYLRNIPRGSAAVVTDLIDTFKDRDELIEYLDLLLSRVRTVFCSSNIARDWHDALGTRYDVSVSKYFQSYLLTIRKQ